MRIRLTREGIRFVVLLAVVGFAAYNPHNNLIFLSLSVGIAAVVVALASGLISVRALRLEPTGLPDAYAGRAFTERLRLGNRSRLLDGFGISVEEGASRVGFLPRRGSELFTVSRTLPRRGLHREAPIRLSTCFPFGLFRLERRFDLGRELLVFPEVRSIDPSSLAVPGRGGAGSGGHPGLGDEFFRLREYESGDAVHHVHWRTTAKVGTLMVRELGDAQEERLALTFDPVLAEGMERDDFERIVTATASIARHLADEGASFRFFSPELDLPPRGGPDHLRAVLAHLALVAPVPTELAGGWRARLASARDRAQTVIFVACDGRRLASVPEGALRVVSPERVLRGERTA